MRVSIITEQAQGDIDVEIALLEKQVDLNSDDVEVYLHLSTLYRQKADYKKAWDFLQKAENLLPRTFNI
jgi:tetratricopeptide (TPR) repeat protein